MNGNFLGKWHAWKTINKYNEERIAYTRSADPSVGDEVDIYGRIRDGVYYGSDNWGTHLEDVENDLQVDYNKPIKYARVAVHHERSPRGFELQSTNLTCEDLSDTGATYMLYYEDDGDVHQGELTFADIQDGDTYWGCPDIDACCFIFCHEGTVGVTYMG